MCKMYIACKMSDFICIRRYEKAARYNRELIEPISYCRIIYTFVYIVTTILMRAEKDRRNARAS